MLRGDFGPITDGEVWQMLYISELHELFKEAHITEVLKIV